MYVDMFLCNIFSKISNSNFVFFHNLYSPSFKLFRFFFCQTTARIIEDHKPLVEDLNVTGAELQDMCTDEDASDLKEDVDNVNAKYDNVKAAIRQKLSDLDETLRNSSTDVSPVAMNF